MSHRLCQKRSFSGIEHIVFLVTPPFSSQQPVAEKVRKEITDRDVEMGFDIARTMHKGQVYIQQDFCISDWV